MPLTRGRRSSSQEGEWNVGEPPVDGQVGPEREERSNEQENHRQLHAGATTGPQGEESGEDEDWDTDVAAGLRGSALWPGGTRATHPQ